jgi:hypothetical protein
LFLNIYFLKAPSKDFINRVILDAFAYRKNTAIPENVKIYISESMDIDKNTSEQVIHLSFGKKIA